MRVARISRADDPRIAWYRDVRDPELARARGLFVAEGRLVVQRLIEGGRHTVESLLVSDRALDSLSLALRRLPDDVPVYVCDVPGLSAIAGYHVHRGCLALAHRADDLAVSELAAAARRIVILEGVGDADNVGGIFRNAAAFDVDAVLLSPTCCDPLYRKAIRTSMAATLRVPFARIEEWPAGLSSIREAGFTLVALTPRKPSEDLAAFAARARPQKVALLLGTEGAGLTPEAETAADVRVRIPIGEEIDSLNVAVAAGIALYAMGPSASE